MNNTTEIKMSKEEETYYQNQYAYMVAEINQISAIRLAEHQARMSRFYTAPYNN
jgi:hypothetical protein